MVIGSMNLNIPQLATGSEFMPFCQGLKQGDVDKLGVGHKQFILFVLCIFLNLWLPLTLGNISTDSGFAFFCVRSILMFSFTCF